MKQGLYTLRRRRALARGVWELRLSGDTGPITAPGQFVNIQLDGCFLRRPISVCHWDEDSLTLVFKVVGKGTAALAELREGQTLDLLCGLGNGFDLSCCGQRPLLVGGGLGVAPLYGLAKALLAEGRKPTAVLGFNSKDDIFYEEEFRTLGVDTVITTVDGSAGVKGFVTDALPERYDVFCACGPLPMMKAVCAAAPTPGFVSLEERMGCGFGACMGCSCETKAGSKRICRDGPVFAKEELLW
ncbi:MAG: dihydroorotate dehydrogenase electron transfer subunit [Clostridiales bacterium]|nr:dihydroorotate dehydrogenase electron transfer subunit [Clostridiales bacterium]